mgnify:FL=1
MNQEFVGDLVVNLAILCGFLAVLGVGGLIADYVFPHIPFIQRFLDTLPDWDEDEDEFEKGESRR